MSHYDFWKSGWKLQNSEPTTRTTTMTRASRSWTCGFCRTTNKAQLKRCSQCYAWREGVQRDDDVPPPACTDEEAATLMLQIAATDMPPPLPPKKRQLRTMQTSRTKSRAVQTLETSPSFPQAVAVTQSLPADVTVVEGMLIKERDAVPEAPTPPLSSEQTLALIMNMAQTLTVVDRAKLLCKIADTIPEKDKNGLSWELSRDNGRVHKLVAKTPLKPLHQSLSELNVREQTDVLMKSGCLKDTLTEKIVVRTMLDKTDVFCKAMSNVSRLSFAKHGHIAMNATSRLVQRPDFKTQHVNTEHRRIMFQIAENVLELAFVGTNPFTRMHAWSHLCSHDTDGQVKTFYLSEYMTMARIVLREEDECSTIDDWLKCGSRMSSWSKHAQEWIDNGGVHNPDNIPPLINTMHPGAPHSLYIKRFRMMK